MAQETSRTFDTAGAAVIVTIRDEFGNDSVHTIALVSDDVDVNAQVTSLIVETDARTAALRERMIKNGWQPS